MKFRIISGKDLVLVCSSEKTSELSITHASECLQVEVGEGNALIKRTPAGKIVVCLGRVVGRRNSSGELISIESLELFLANQADHVSIGKLAQQLEGRFLLFIVGNDGICRVCSDCFAKIEVFIQKVESGVVLASDLSLLPEDPAREGYDQAALVHTLTYYGYCPPKHHTIYKGVRRLGIGEAAVLDNGQLSVESTPFAPAKMAEYGEREHEEYVDIFLDHLKAAGSSEGNVVYLSSGWDSTSILAGLIHLFGARKVRAVIGRMRYSERSGICNQFEIDRARKIADYYGIRLDTVDFEYLEDGPDFFAHTAPAMRDHQLYSLTCLSHGRLAEKVCATSVNENEVIFAGEISDGVHNLGFSQYATIFHPVHDFREYSDKMASYLFGPTFLSLLQQGEHEKDPIYGMFRARASGVKFDAVDSDSEKRTLQLFTSFFLRNGRMPMWSLENSRLLTAKGRDAYTQEMQDSYLKEAAENATGDTLYAWYLHLYNSFHWQGSTVRTLSVLADEYHLQTDLPFWDARLHEFLSSMPEDWGRGLDLNPTKFPLKWMLKNRLDYPYDLQKGPHSYTYDVDHSFNHAEEVFCHSKMTPILQKALSDKPYHQILSPEVFDLEFIDTLVEDYVGGKAMPASALSELVPLALLSLIGWYGPK